jgi:catechol 2,3-dioxygenase-like lactoylglutathione lyase family enzyme
MKPRITVVTIGVDDLERALRFYRDGLGLATEGIIGKEFEYGAVVFIELQAGLRLALWPRRSIAHDSGCRWGRQVPRSSRSGTMCRPRRKWLLSCSRRGTLAPSSSSQPRRRFGAGTLGIFKTLTVISGRWRGTRNGLCKIEASQGLTTAWATSGMVLPRLPGAGAAGCPASVRSLRCLADLSQQ